VPSDGLPCWGQSPLDVWVTVGVEPGLRAGAPLTHVRGLPSRESPARSIRQWWEAPVFTERTSVGLDVHARSVAAAAIDSVTSEVQQTRLTPSYEHIRSWISELPGPVAVAYEAGPTGFGLQRALTGAGIRCEVVRALVCARRAGLGGLRGLSREDSIRRASDPPVSPPTASDQPLTARCGSSLPAATAASEKRPQCGYCVPNHR
jgi:hypothetical protein